MMNGPYFAESELPPKPDPTTGEPRPPRAPGFHKEEKPPKELDQDREHSSRRKPSPPVGEGPLLEWYRPSQRSAIQGGILGFIILVIGLVVVRGLSFKWMVFWPVWLIVVVGAFGIYMSFRTQECAVGAEWLKVGRTWVKLYELTEIKVRHRSNAMHVDFKDRHDHVVQIQCDHIQEDRDMWDLVYNGILHSVIVGGAKTNNAVHSALAVPRSGNSRS